MSMAAGASAGRGWAIVAAMFVTTMLSVGTTLYAFGVLVKPISAELGLSRAAVNMGLVLLQLGGAVAGPMIGRMIDRASARWILVVAGFLFAGAFVAIASTSNLWVIAVALLVPLAFGWVATGSLIGTTLAVRWVRDRRALAMGIIAASTSAGGLVVVPLVVWLVSHVGWRAAMMIEGITVGVVVVLLALLVVRDWPDGPTEDAGARTATSRTAPIPVMHFLRLRNFWLVALAAGTLMAVDQALLASLIPFATDGGLSLVEAGFLMSCLTGAGIAGKLAIAALADRVDKRLLFCVIALSNAAFLALLLGEPPYAVLLPVCCVMGLVLGGTIPVWYALIADLFGARSFGSVMGAMGPISLALSMTAMRFVGASYDAHGDYAQAFRIFLAASLLTILLIFLARMPARGEPGGGDRPALAG
ncbi:MFS transporter [Flavisphingomonas formosensis]|uniref:MFS transporter n=1 Tax=Flavisphingomonas formosensis TaxID=861534 RepID=UPI0012F8A164|nr:MFS transporter [Sphingomonas formosensis]